MKMIKLDIRSATPKDSSLYIGWRNDPQVREAAFTTEKISQEMHDTWYESKLNNDRSKLFVIHEKSGAVGQVRFEISADYSSAEINYSIANEYRGQKLAIPLMELAIQAFLENNQKINQLIAKVKKENIASNRVFEKLKFSQIEQAESSMNVFEFLL